ncbi:MAG: DEAD/DEAH box helicase, partial [Pseudomonadota bacterium]
MAFVTLSKEQFEACLPADSKELELAGSWERVYCVPTTKEGISVRVYSTVDKRTDITRGLGKDAIRIVHWDNVNDRPLSKGKKILRVEGVTTIEQRIKQRVMEFLMGAIDRCIVDFQYVRAVLASSAVNWMDFAQSLLEGLDKFSSLTDGQLAYVLGDRNPKGKPTFEARAKEKDPDFLQKYLDSLDEEVDRNGEQEEGLPDEEGPQAAKHGASQAEDNQGGKSILDGGGDGGGRDRGFPEEETPTRLIPTSEYAYYKYPFVEFNPVQSLVFPHQSKDKNMVVGANTSAGKTICAEFLMDDVLAKGKRIVYMSPLKSLAQEKYNDWQRRFLKEEICILTGDYVLSDDMKEKLGRSRIIIMTSEMVDSRTRRMESEKNYWLKEVGLLIVDEAHILSTSRGHAVETGIMRFTRINPKARVLFLSATMPNVAELGEWLAGL